MKIKQWSFSLSRNIRSSRWQQGGNILNGLLIQIIRDHQLTFVGYLLFVKEYCMISEVQVGRFKSPTTIIDSISLNNDLFTEVDEIIAFIKKHLMVEYIIT